MTEPLILDIKCNSLDDGPGVRTVVFFKGCPLSCVWCHNPESKSQTVELNFNKVECIGCNSCIKACNMNALNTSNKFFVDRDKCNLCFKCVDVCPAKALTMAGKNATINDLFEKILSDKVFYDISGGGITLSGGEVTLFPSFAGEVLEKCKHHNINTLIETCGAFNYAQFEKKMLPFIDIIYYDLKIFDADSHKIYCGASNEVILKNFEKLYEHSKRHPLTLLARIPLIPNITDTSQNLTSIANFLKNLGVRKAQLLPYNPTWYPKNDAIGHETHESIKNSRAWQTKEKVDECKKIFTNKNITV